MPAVTLKLGEFRDHLITKAIPEWIKAGVARDEILKRLAAIATAKNLTEIKQNLKRFEIELDGSFLDNHALPICEAAAIAYISTTLAHAIDADSASGNQFATEVYAAADPKNVGIFLGKTQGGYVFTRLNRDTESHLSEKKEANIAALFRQTYNELPETLRHAAHATAVAIKSVKRDAHIREIQELCSNTTDCTDDDHNTKLNVFITAASGLAGNVADAHGLDAQLQQIKAVINPSKQAECDTALRSITTVEDVKLLGKALEEAVRKRNETPAIKAFVAWVEERKIVEDDKLRQFLKHDFSGKDKGGIEAQIDTLTKSDTISLEFNRWRDTITTPELAQQLQNAIKAKLTEMKQAENDKQAEIEKIVTWCHEGRLAAKNLVDFSKQDLDALGVHIDNLVNALLPDSLCSTQKDKDMRDHFLTAANKDNALALQKALRDALPDFLTPDEKIDRPSLTMGAGTGEGRLIDTVLKWHNDGNVNAKKLHAFLALEPSDFDGKTQTQLLHLLNEIKSGFLTQALQDPGLGLDNLKAAVKQLQKELQAAVTKKESNTNQGLAGGPVFNEPQRQFITAELLYRMQEGQLNQDKLEAFMALSLPDSPGELKRGDIDQATLLLYQMASKPDDHFFQQSFGTTDSYFNQLKTSCENNNTLILKALKELQTSFKKHQVKVTKSDILTFADLVKYLEENSPEKDWVEFLKSENWNCNEAKALRKNIAQFAKDVPETAKLHANLEKLLEIFEKDQPPAENSDEETLLKEFYEFVVNQNRATVTKSPELKTVFAKFDNVFSQQEKAAKAAKADNASEDVKNAAFFESVKFEDPAKKDKVTVVTKGTGDVKERTATITHQNKGKKDESLDVVGSMQAVVSAIVALYKAEYQSSPGAKFSIDIASLDLRNAANQPLAGAKLETMAKMLDKEFETEFSGYDKGSAKKSFDSMKEPVSAKVPSWTGQGARQGGQAGMFPPGAGKQETDLSDDEESSKKPVAPGVPRK